RRVGSWKLPLLWRSGTDAAAQDGAKSLSTADGRRWTRIGDTSSRFPSALLGSRDAKSQRSDYPRESVSICGSIAVLGSELCVPPFVAKNGSSPTRLERRLPTASLFPPLRPSRLCGFALKL